MEVESDFENSVASEEDIEQEAEQLELSKEFHENVIKYVKLDDLMRKKQDEIKELKKLRKTPEEFIITYLEDIKVSQIDISDGKLKRKRTETKVPINNKIIKTALDKKIEDPKVVQDIMKMVDEREKRVKVKLDRVKNKIPKQPN